MTYKAEVDQDLCISSGRCVSDLPTVFAFDEDQLATVIGADQAIDDARLLRLARNCPGQAITLRDEHGGLIDLDG
jgi:ferredoxin